MLLDSIYFRLSRGGAGGPGRPAPPRHDPPGVREGRRYKLRGWVMRKTRAQARGVGLVLAALAVLVLAGGPARASDRKVEERTRSYLEDEKRAKFILFFLHPTAEYRKVECLRVSGVVDGLGKPRKDWF